MSRPVTLVEAEAICAAIIGRRSALLLHAWSSREAQQRYQHGPSPQQALSQAIAYAAGLHDRSRITVRRIWNAHANG